MPRKGPNVQRERLFSPHDRIALEGKLQGLRKGLRPESRMRSPSQREPQLNKLPLPKSKNKRLMT